MEQASSTLLDLVEERDRLAALTNETMEALQKIGEEFGVYGGERRVDGIRRVLTELRARAEAAEATLLDAQKRLRGAGMLGGDNDPVNAALQGRDGDG